MKNKVIFKRVILTSIITLAFIIVALVLFIIINYFRLNNKDNDLSSIKSAIEHVFYYLPNDEYNDMNSMSDYCKLALIYDTDFLESDNIIYSDDGNKIEAYSIINVLSSLKKVLGPDSNFDYSVDDTGNYAFLTSDNCQFGNLKASNLSFDSGNNLIYALDKIESNREVYIKWTDEIIDENNVTLYAKALMSVKSDEGYDLYIDVNMTNLVGHYDSLEELKKELDKNYFLSYNYEFHLEKNDDNYVWKSFTKNSMNKIIVD